MPDHYNLYHRKALIALAGAEAEFAAGRYDNAVGRAYYYCYHLAVAARIAAGDSPDNRLGEWRHGPTLRAMDVLVAAWSESTHLVGRLAELYLARLRADYELLPLTEMEGAETIERAKELGDAIERHVPFRLN